MILFILTTLKASREHKPMLISNGSCFGDLTLKGQDPSKRQDDNPLRIKAPDNEVVQFQHLKITDCGMPIRHESGKLKIQTLECKRFTADLFNSHGDLEIVNIIVDYDGSDFTEEDYKKLHPDALGQFFNKTTKKCGNVKIHNIYATIRGKLIQGFALTEDHDYHNFDINIGDGYINIDYKYAFFANTLRDSKLNLGNNGVKILKRKPTRYVSAGTKIIQHSDNQIIVLDKDSSVLKVLAEYDRITGMETKTKIGFIIGHNSKSQGKARFGTTEFKFWSKFLDENIDLFEIEAEKHNIELRVFSRRYSGGYHKEMRELHGRIDKWGANISVSCHYNASASSATGHEVEFYRNSKGGKLIAGIFDKAMNKTLKNRDRGAKIAERGSYGLKVGKAKSILIEPMFSKELRDYMEGGSQRQALVNMFIEFFKTVNKANTAIPDRKQITHERTYDITDSDIERLARELGLFV